MLKHLHRDPADLCKYLIGTSSIGSISGLALATTGLNLPKMALPGSSSPDNPRFPSIPAPRYFI